MEFHGELRFHPAADPDASAVTAVQRRLRTRVLRAAVRHGTLSSEVAADFARWGHSGGFSLHAAVRIEAEDRAGLERLLRYCARPAFASEQLRWNPSDAQVRYTLPRPLPNGQTTLALSPLKLLDHLAALIPPPRRHRHHYFGVFAPHAALRARIDEARRLTPARAATPDPHDERSHPLDHHPHARDSLRVTRCPRVRAPTPQRKRRFKFPIPVNFLLVPTIP